MKKISKQKQFLLESDSNDGQSSETDESASESSDSDSSSFENNISSHSDNDPDEKNEFSWTKYNRQNKLELMYQEFKQAKGVDKKVKPIKEPIDSFSLFFDGQLYNSFSEETNNYYLTKKQNHQQKTKHKQWEKPSIAEIKCFIGILIYMGLIDKPTVEMYWSKYELFSSIQFKQLINFERFQTILSCLSFFKIQNEQDQALSKLSTLISYLIEKFQAFYHPEQNLSVDETMVKFSGRSAFKIYMPLKPIKYCFKAYVLSESSTGYVLNWNLYIGKKLSLIDIMRNLVQKYIHKGFIVSFDRFYSSISVLQYLTQAGFKCYQVAIKSRLKIDENIQIDINNLKPYELLFYISNCKNMMLTLWKDSKLVCLLTNCRTNEVGQTTRTKKQQSSQQVNCPQNIMHYQQNAKGVDLMDQMISYYIQNRRSKKWYIRILHHLLQVSIFNSYIIYKKKTKRNISLIDYNQKLIFSLIEEQSNNLKQQKLRKEQKTCQVQKRLNNQDIEDQCKLSKGYLKDCFICQQKNQRKKSSYFCEKHEINICIIPCYDLHRKSVLF